MKHNTGKVNFSNSDIKRKVTIPKDLTASLCEIIGILNGDGCLYKRKNRYEIYIYGDSNEDIQYHETKIKSLFKNVFIIEPKIQKIKNKNAIRSRIDSKAIFTFLNNSIGIAYGNKKTRIKIPKKILRKKEFIYAYLRGLADTDFYLKFKRRKDVKNTSHFYPIIIGKFASKSFVKELSALLKTINLSNHIEKEIRNLNGNYHKAYSINIVGKLNLERWMDKIEFNNRRHLTKYLIWKKFGYLLPRTTLQERETLLKSI